MGRGTFQQAIMALQRPLAGANTPAVAIKHVVPRYLNSGEDFVSVGIVDHPQHCSPDPPSPLVTNTPTRGHDSAAPGAMTDK